MSRRQRPGCGSAVGTAGRDPSVQAGSPLTKAKCWTLIIVNFKRGLDPGLLSALYTLPEAHDPPPSQPHSWDTGRTSDPATTPRLLPTLLSPSAGSPSAQSHTQTETHTGHLSGGQRDHKSPWGFLSQLWSTRASAAEEDRAAVHRPLTGPALLAGASWSSQCHHTVSFPHQNTPTAVCATRQASWDLQRGPAASLRDRHSTKRRDCKPEETIPTPPPVQRRSLGQRQWLITVLRKARQRPRQSCRLRTPLVTTPLSPSRGKFTLADGHFLLPGAQQSTPNHSGVTPTCDITERRDGKDHEPQLCSRRSRRGGKAQSSGLRRRRNSEPGSQAHAHYR